MMKKGSITIFLALILSLLVSLVCTSLESVRMAAARTQILNSLDIGLFSLFGQYDKELLEEYDLFFLDGSCGGGTLNMAGIYDNLESYMKPVLKQNSQKLQISQGGFTGYRLATDENGEVFYQQVIQYMKGTLGSQGVQLLLDRIRSRNSKTQEANSAGQQAEQGNALENYETEMNTAEQNSQAAMQEAKNNQQQEGNAQADFSSGEEFTDGETQTPAPVVNNPITTIKRIRQMGILELVIPGEKSVSQNTVDKTVLLSGRTQQQGLSMAASQEKDTSYTSCILFQQYLMDHLGNYSKASGNGLQYQMEYVINGERDDTKNLRAIANKLLLIREGINMTYLLADAEKRAQAEALALAIASGFLIPPAASVIEGALLLCWSFAESILDVRELFDGGKVALVKTAADWQLSLENLSNLLEGLDTVRKSSEGGMSYEDYLQVLLLSVSKEKKLKRGMDMLEQQIRQKLGRSAFQLDSCIEALEAVVDVKANRRKTFTVTKQYCYNQA